MGRRTQLMAAIGMVVAGLAMTSQASEAGDGDPDTSFGDDGIVVTEGGYGRAVSVQLDGKIVVAGGAGSGVMVLRYDASGSLDTTFGDNGIVLTDVGEPSAADAVGLYPDGRVVIAGWRGQPGSGSRDVLVVRYAADGSLDTSLDDDGIVITDIDSGDDIGSSLAVQPDGKLVVAGTRSAQVSTYVDATDVLVLRYDLDGRLDPTFGNEGAVLTDDGANESGRSSALQSDGKIVVAGTTAPEVCRRPCASDMLLVRYDPSGELDSTFGDGGFATADHGHGDRGMSVALQADGKIVVAGGTGTDRDNAVLLSRHHVDGAPDATFGESGIVTNDISRFPGFDHHEEVLGQDATSIALQADGRLVVAGSWGDEGHMFLLRYSRDGAVDPTFGLDGATFVDEGDETPVALDLQADGKPVTAGNACSGREEVCSRTEPGGVLVVRFGTKPGLAPEFDPPISTSEGFTVRVTNYDAAYAWSVESTAGGGDAEIDSSGLITVTNICGWGTNATCQPTPPDASATVTATTSRPGFEDASASVTGSSLRAGLLPEFGPPRSTDDGINVQVTNFDATFTWTVTSTSGTADIDSNGLIIVTGLAPDTTVTITASTSLPGHNGASATVTGSSLPSILPPTGARTPTALAISALLVGISLLLASSGHRTSRNTTSPVKVGGAG